MNIPETYNYLIRARRDLWATLESVPDAVLSLPIPNGGELRCIKDLVFHIAGVEDFWIHEDILRDEPVLHRTVALKGILTEQPQRIFRLPRWWITGMLWNRARLLSSVD